MEVQTKPAPKEDRRQNDRPIFSAYEVGKIAISQYDISRITENRITILHEDMPALDVFNLYQEFETLDFLPVQCMDGHICGYILRQMFLAALSKNRFARELILRPDVTVASIMDRRVVALDAFTTLPDASKILMRRDEDIRFDPFVISLDGAYYGISNVRRVLDGLNFYMQMDMDACNEAQETLVLDTNVLHIDPDQPFRFAHFLSPLKGPGGDYVASYELNDRLTLLMLFDVCGKGLKAANMVMNIGSVIKSWVDLTLKQKEHELDINNVNLFENMTRINDMVFHMTPGDMYATGVVLLIDKQQQILQLFDYGHGFIWLRRKDKVFELTPKDNRVVDESHMPFFGITENFQLKPITYQLKPGDMIYTCSDGIPEAFNTHKEEFQSDRIKDIMLRFDGENPQDLNKQIRDSWEEFRQGYRRTDDVSMFTIFI